MWYYYGSYGILFLCMFISLWAQIKVKTTFSKYDKIYSLKGHTGFSAARQILDQNGLSHVRLEVISGHLTDHYDPRANVIRLSESVANSYSVAAIGVAAHECGHAIQYAEEYKPIVFRNAIVKSTNFCSNISFILIFAGVLITAIYEMAGNLGTVLIYSGIIAFAAVAFFQLVTLPVEFNASRRALAIINEQGILKEEERAGARKVLTAAAMTYVAALVVSLLQLIRLIMIFGRRD